MALVDLTKLLRYSGVSVIATAVGMTVLGVLVGVAGMAAAWANVIATGAGTAPSFELNRRWVWGKAVERSIAVEVANLSAFGSLWVLQFFVLDRVLFRNREIAGVV